MKANIGEELVGAYLTEVLGCHHVSYNARPPGGGLKGLAELDVIGFDFDAKKVYLCEVTTHLRGALYVDNKTTADRILRKHESQKAYAKNHLKGFPTREFMFWSPRVPVGAITKRLVAAKGLQLIINGEYKRRVEELRKKACEYVRDTNNSAFRMLQILEHVRG